MGETKVFLSNLARRLARWLGDQPIVMWFTDPPRLKTRDREEVIALITVPLLAVAVVVAGGVAINGHSSVVSPPIAEADDDAVSKKIPPVDIVVDDELEEFHSAARYLSNLEEYRNAITQLRLDDESQEQRVAEVLGWLEVREWEFVGEFEGDVCFRYEDRVECVNSEMFESLATAGQQYAASHPEGIGLCFDWFDDVCMSGDWFDSRMAFDEAITATVSYVITGSQSREENPNNLDTSPTYEASRLATITDPDFFSANEWEEITRILFPDRPPGELRVSPNTEGEGFCIGTEFDGDCFASQEALDRAMSELQQAYRDGTCSGWATGSDGISVCTAIWVGNWPNHTSMPLGEALCDNNTGRCELIPNTDRTCLYNCSITR